MRIKYQRDSAFQQTGNRFEVDKDQYYLILFVKFQIDLICYITSKAQDLRAFSCLYQNSNRPLQHDLCKIRF